MVIEEVLVNSAYSGARYEELLEVGVALADDLGLGKIETHLDLLRQLRYKVMRVTVCGMCLYESAELEFDNFVL